MGEWIIRQINAILIHFIGGFYNTIVVPILKWFINHSSKTPLLTELVPENFLKAITTLSLLLLAAFLSYGVVMAMTGKTLGLQSELTPSQLFIRIGIAILIIMISTIAINEMIELSNNLISSIQIENTDFDKVIEKIMADYVIIAKKAGFNRGEPIYDPYGQVIVGYSNDYNPPEPNTAILIQIIVVIIAFIFLLIMIVRFLVFWIKRIALIAVFGAFSPIAAILYILPGTAQYAKIIWKKIVLDIFTIFLVLLAISIGASVVGNEKILGTIFERADNQWMSITFQLVLLITIFMLALKIPEILDRAVGVDLGAFAIWMFTASYAWRSIKWGKGKYDESKEKNNAEGGSNFIKLSKSKNKNFYKSSSNYHSKKAPEIVSREYKGSLKDAPQYLYNKWYVNYMNDTGYSPALFKDSARKYNFAKKDPAKMSEFSKEFPEQKVKFNRAYDNYFLNKKNMNVKKYREKFEI
jgi:hypothetical protein